MSPVFAQTVGACICMVMDDGDALEVETRYVLTDER